MTMLKRMTSIAAFVEGSYNETFDKSEAAGGAVAAAMFYCYDLNFAPAMEALRRSIYRASLGATAPMMGAQSGQVTFTMELMGQSSAGDIPPFGELLQMCGMKEYNNAARCTLYEPQDPTGIDPLESGSIILYQDQLKHILTGCRGTFSLGFEAGAIATIAFTIDCMQFTWTDNASGGPAGTGLPIIQPPTVKSALFAVGNPTKNTSGVAWAGAVVPSITLDMNNTIARGKSINTATGYKSVEITGRGPTGNMSPEAVLLDTHPFYTAWANGEKADLRWQVGSTAGNTITIFIPAAYYNAMSFEERDGILAHPTPFDVCLAGETETITSSGAGTTSTIIDSSTFTTDAADARTYVGRRIECTYGPNNGQVAVITSVNGGTTTATVTPAFTTNPGTGATFEIGNKELLILCT